MAAGLTEEDKDSIARNNTDKIQYNAEGTGATYKATATVTFVQTDLAKWENTPSIGGINPGTPAATKTVEYDASTGKVTIK